MKPGERSLPGLIASLRAVFDRFGHTTLIVLAILLLVVGKVDVKIVDYLGGQAGGLFVPVLGLMNEPVRITRRIASRLGELLAIRAENDRLREENRRLLAWQTEATRLSVENGALREQLDIPLIEEAPRFTTARVVADPGSPFVHTLLIDAGADRGIENGMAAVNERGMVGRVIQVGPVSSRILLLTDFNSRIPVIVESSRDAAILEGDNSPRPLLRFLPLNPRLVVGDRVLTSGDGGFLAPGLVVGEVSSIAENKVLVAPYVDWSRLDYLTILKYERLPPPDGAVEPGGPRTPRVQGHAPYS